VSGRCLNSYIIDFWLFLDYKITNISQRLGAASPDPCSISRLLCLIQPPSRKSWLWACVLCYAAAEVPMLYIYIYIYICCMYTMFVLPNAAMCYYVVLVCSSACQGESVQPACSYAAVLGGSWVDNKWAGCVNLRMGGGRHRPCKRITFVIVH